MYLLYTDTGYLLVEHSHLVKHSSHLLYFKLIFYPICTMMLIKCIAHEFTQGHMCESPSIFVIPRMCACVGVCGCVCVSQIIAYYKLCNFTTATTHLEELKSSHKRQTGKIRFKTMPRGVKMKQVKARCGKWRQLGATRGKSSGEESSQVKGALIFNKQNC